MSKGGKVTNGGVVGNVYCKMQKFVLQKSEWKNLLIKKYVQYQQFSSYWTLHNMHYFLN